VEDFDPYLLWLGIRDPGRPPNYYRLLGVELFESDPDVLVNAADRQMSHVRTFQTGKHVAESQRILNELATAKLCLLDPQRKAEYDAQLMAQLRAASQAYASVAAPVAAPAEAPPAPMVTPVPATSDWPSRSPRYLLIVIPVLVSMIAVLVALTLLMFGRRGTDEGPDRVARSGESHPAAEPETPRDAEVRPGSASEPEPGSGAPAPPAERGKQREPRAPSVPETRPAPGAQVAPPRQSQPDTQPEPAIAPDKLPPVSESIGAARAAMAARDPEAARRHLALAEQAAFPRDRGQIGQLQEALSPFSAFWKAVRRGMQALKPGESLAAGGQEVTVSEVAADSITLRAGEEETQYTIATLPPEVALAIADRQLPDLPASLLSKAAFLVFDPQADRSLARQLCADAAGQGLPVQALLAELERETAPPAGPPKPGDGSKPPVPDEAALSEARRKVREVFHDRYAKALKPEEKGALARDLLNEAIDTTDNPVARYVLFVEARDLAVQAGSASLVSEAIEQMAKHYDVNEREEITRTLFEAVARPLLSAARRDLAVEAIDQVEKAIRDDDYEAAATLAKVANTLALKGIDATTAKEAEALMAEVPLLKQQYESSLEAAKALAADPANPQANLALGKYYCFFKREPRWTQGLPLLAKGDDAVLKALAEAEAGVSAASEAAEKVELADQWHEASNSVDKEIREQVRARAAYWYKQALGDLSGFTKTRVEKLLEEIDVPKPDLRRP